MRRAPFRCDENTYPVRVAVKARKPRGAPSEGYFLAFFLVAFFAFFLVALAFLAFFLAAMCVLPC